MNILLLLLLLIVVKLWDLYILALVRLIWNLVLLCFKKIRKIHNIYIYKIFIKFKSFIV
jgi:hypothetical protein